MQGRRKQSLVLNKLWEVERLLTMISTQKNVLLFYRFLEEKSQSVRPVEQLYNNCLRLTHFDGVKNISCFIQILLLYLLLKWTFVDMNTFFLVGKNVMQNRYYCNLFLFF